MRIKNSLLAAILAVSSFVSGQAHAALAIEGSATIDWFSLSISTTGGMTVDVFDVADFVTATGNFAFDTSLPLGTLPGGGSAAFASDGFATASAVTDPSGDLLGTLTAFTSLDSPSPNPIDQAAADAFRLAFIVATGDGTVTVELDYMLTVTATALAAPAFSTVFAEVNVGEVLPALPGDPLAIAGVQSEQLFLGGGAGAVDDSLFGTITFEKDLLDGEGFTFIAGAQVAARNTPIPLPASLFLILPAVGMLAMRRRRI